ncbi:conserved hypothetical protein [Gammaproteobacteria bacterium]
MQNARRHVAASRTRPLPYVVGVAAASVPAAHQRQIREAVSAWLYRGISKSKSIAYFFHAPLVSPMPNAAPIALFIFRRHEHLRKTLTGLQRCEGFSGSRVVVFGDGPKRDEQRVGIEAARAVAREMLGEEAEYRFSETNKGLARSIIDGVGALIAEHGRVIVIEDDLDLAPGFLTFMDAALDRYAGDETVYQVSGHAFDAPELMDCKSAVFLPFTTTWGWATWARAWRHMDEAAIGWEQLARDRDLRRRFNLGGVYDFATMIERQKKGRTDSWGILWYWSVFRGNGLTLAPPRTLVHNTGMDGSGSHGRGVLRRHNAKRQEFPATTYDLPPPLLDRKSFEVVKRAIWRQNGGAIGQIVDAVKRMALPLLKR